MQATTLPSLSEQTLTQEVRELHKGKAVARPCELWVAKLGRPCGRQAQWVAHLTCPTHDMLGATLLCRKHKREFDKGRLTHGNGCSDVLAVTWMERI